jgi:hypothetical protein
MTSHQFQPNFESYDARRGSAGAVHCGISLKRLGSSTSVEVRHSDRIGLILSYRFILLSDKTSMWLFRFPVMSDFEFMQLPSKLY